jgi:polysaccharide biosynthesis transport protein
MSNEIQLAMNPTLPAAPGAFGGPLGAPLGSVAEEPTMLRKAHRLLRGRYLLAITLGLLVGAAGGAAGFMSQKPVWRSDAFIEVEARIPVSGPAADRVTALFSQYLQKQLFKLKNERTIRFAMKTKEWQAVRPGAPTDDQVAAFNEKLAVSLPPKSSGLIQVSFSETSADAKQVAPAAVKAVIAAYKALSADGGDSEDQFVDRKIEHWTKQQKAAEETIQRRRQSIDQLSKVGDDDAMMLRARHEQLLVLKKSLQDAEDMYAQALEDLKQAEKAAGANNQPTVEDWARVDPTMEGQVRMRSEQLFRHSSLQAQLGEKHHFVVRSAQDLELRDKFMKDYAAELNAKYVIRWKPDGTGGALIPRNLEGLKLSVERLRGTYKREADAVEALRQAGNQIAIARDEIREANEKSRIAGEQLRELEFQKEHLKRINVVVEGTVPAIDKDRRPIFAAIGFMGGAAVPIGLLMLIGLLDSRYRFSDETNSEMKGLTLLGILPNLPDRLSDPEQAAIAAHCVHQIRTMLQINSTTGDRRVFAVTSAAPGDGKTSLTLALGLSYAACGTRTLLIDCDLIGAGLTSRLNVNAAEGVLEAIANRSLLQYVRSTDIADVAILPVGSAGNLHASTLSPAALRGLIEEAEKHFETILIDTGPILGSIEASLVCAAADAVILTVARGQQRPMVEKSLSHLAAIGAKLAGVVFNRAQASDFERSISGVSMRSVGQHLQRGSSNASARAGNRFGPVARAVATQVQSADAEDARQG